MYLRVGLLIGGLVFIGYLSLELAHSPSLDELPDVNSLRVSAGPDINRVTAVVSRKFREHALEPQLKLIPVATVPAYSGSVGTYPVADAAAVSDDSGVAREETLFYTVAGEIEWAIDLESSCRAEILDSLCRLTVEEPFPIRVTLAEDTERVVPGRVGAEPSAGQLSACVRVCRARIEPELLRRGREAAYSRVAQIAARARLAALVQEALETEGLWGRAGILRVEVVFRPSRGDSDSEHL